MVTASKGELDGYMRGNGKTIKRPGMLLYCYKTDCLNLYYSSFIDFFAVIAELSNFDSFTLGLCAHRFPLDQYPLTPSMCTDIDVCALSPKFRFGKKV